MKQISLKAIIIILTARVLVIHKTSKDYNCLVRTQRIREHFKYKNNDILSQSLCLEKKEKILIENYKSDKK